ncbi:MAG: hypothetical protein ACE366_20350 [Bradymonadia bacterium]
MSTHKVIAAIKAESLEQVWHETLDHWEDAEAQDRQRVYAWASGLRDQFVDHLIEVDDDEELIFAIALRYIELRCHWQMLNTQLNYQMFRRGECSPELQMRSSTLSQLIERISPFITDEDTARIGEFLLAPVSEAA